MPEELLVTGLRTSIPELEILLRLLLASLFGAIIGFDREVRRKPAGLRTHMLVSLAAAIFTVITFELFEQVQASAERPTADPIRLIEAVTAGVAFLAAGAIIQSRDTVRGLTTGAGLWLAGAVGMACGAGYYVIAVLGTVLALIVLAAIGWIERRLFRRGGKGQG